jgi:hypothetical protein
MATQQNHPTLLSPFLTLRTIFLPGTCSLRTLSNNSRFLRQRFNLTCAERSSTAQTTELPQRTLSPLYSSLQLSKENPRSPSSTSSFNTFALSGFSLSKLSATFL